MLLLRYLKRLFRGELGTPYTFSDYAVSEDPAAHARTFGYLAPPELAERLPPESMRRVVMPVDQFDIGRPTGPLSQIWRSIPSGHKWWHYFAVYERFLGELRRTPIRFLEIGVYKGGSLAMWREYFHPDTIIVGIDIDSSCKAYDAPASNVHVRIGDQSDVDFLDRVISEFGPFDVILDDGSHVCSHMIATFGHAFLNGLTDSGLYIAEDTHSNFWPGYRDQAYSFIDFCKDLVDLSHSHYVDNTIWSFSKGDSRRCTGIEVPSIGQQIEEISFFDSMIVVRRSKSRLLPTVEHL